MELLRNPSERAGIIVSQPAVHCQVLEAPEINSSPDPCIPKTHRESTFPIPFGAFSALSALNLGQLTTFEYSVYSAFNYRSNHRSGKTHYLSYRKLAKILHTSVRYIRSAIKSLIAKGFIKQKMDTFTQEIETLKKQRIVS